MSATSQPPTPNTHMPNPAVSHAADGLWSRLSCQRKSLLAHLSVQTQLTHTTHCPFAGTAQTVQSDDVQPMFPPSGETHLAHIHTNHMAVLNRWWEAHRHTNLFVNFKVEAGQRDHTMTSS